MPKSQRVLYGELLTGEQLYRRDLAQVPTWTKEQEQAVVEQARLGDEQARQQVICAMLPRVVPMAIRYGRVARYADWLDLCQIASVDMLLWLERALEVEKPMGYLKAVARRAMTTYLYMDDSLVRKRCHTDFDQEHIETVCLDAPIEEGSEHTWADILADYEQEVSETAEDSFVELYQAIESLTQRQRIVIERNFGLFGCPEEMLCDIDRDLTGRIDPKMRVASGRKHKAIVALRRQLAEECA